MPIDITRFTPQQINVSIVVSWTYQVCILCDGHLCNLFACLSLQVVPYLVKYIDNLTNIYVRFNRKRLKGCTGEEDCKISLSTLYHVSIYKYIQWSTVSNLVQEIVMLQIVYRLMIFRYLPVIYDIFLYHKILRWHLHLFPPCKTVS